VGRVLPGAECALATSVLAVADEIDAADGQTLYYGGSPAMAVQLGAALRGEVERRTAGLHFCAWVKRWSGAGLVDLDGSDVMALEDDHRDFRRALGVPLLPNRR